MFPSQLSHDRVAILVHRSTEYLEYALRGLLLTLEVVRVFLENTVECLRNVLYAVREVLVQLHQLLNIPPSFFASLKFVREIIVCAVVQRVQFGYI